MSVDPGTCRIVCLQVNPELERWQTARQRTLAAVEREVDLGADIVVLPELAFSGYVFAGREEALARSEELTGPTSEELIRIARQSGREVLVIYGFCERDGEGGLHNAAAIVGPSGVLGSYRKLHLWGDEKRWFEAGRKLPPVIETAHGRIAVAICYDIYFPELSRHLALAGVDLLAVPTNAPRNQPGAPTPPAAGGFPQPIQLSIYSTTAHLNGIYIAACDRCGHERGVEWVGASGIFDCHGWPLTTPPAGYGEGALRADCSLTAARDKSRGTQNNLLADRRTDLPELTLSREPETS